MEKKKKGLALKIVSTILLVFAMYNQYSFSFYYSSGSALMVILGLLSIEQYYWHPSSFLRSGRVQVLKAVK